MTNGRARVFRAGHELNESDRGEEIEFEAPLYGLSGNPEGPTYERLPATEDAASNPNYKHTWAYEYDGDEDAPWFDASKLELDRHQDLTRLLADLEQNDAPPPSNDRAR